MEIAKHIASGKKKFKHLRKLQIIYEPAFYFLLVADVSPLLGVSYTGTKEKGSSEKNVQNHQLVERIT